MEIEDKIRMFVEDKILDTIEKKYINIYNDLYLTNKDIVSFCAYIHQLINQCANNYNARIGRHFHAIDSRIYLKAINLIDEFKKITKDTVYEVELCNNNYKEVLDYAKTYLNKTCGSEIPLDAPKLDLVEYDPIFKLNTVSHKNVKNLIFGTNKKPDIIISDVLDSDIEIKSNACKCLIYDKPIDKTLTKKEMINWWNNLNNNCSLFDRLCEPLSDIEKKFFEYYWIHSNDNYPMLIPQVFLHYDPKTIKELIVYKDGEKRLTFQRMDFLMLVKGKRIVIEIDGVQHYSTNNIADTKKYAELVKYDRKMKFLDYDIYRIGGYELINSSFNKTVSEFFNSIKKKYFPEIL